MAGYTAPPGISQADSDVRYVNITGDTMTGNLGAGNYTGTGDQNLVVLAGARSGSGAGLDLSLRASGGAGAGAQNGGNVVLLAGLQSGGGVDGTIQVQSDVTTSAVNLHSIGTAANSFAGLFVNGISGGDDLDIRIDAGFNMSSAPGRDVTIVAGDANTTGAGGDVVIQSGSGAGGGLAGVVTFSGHALRDTTAGITASTTQTQGQQPLVSDVNEVSVVANANDVVTLPAARAGLTIRIINNGANTLQIFPASGDNITGVGVDASVTLAAASRVIYTTYNATDWINV